MSALAWFAWISGAVNVALLLELALLARKLRQMTNDVRRRLR